jgi:hypothetical protein
VQDEASRRAHHDANAERRHRFHASDGDYNASKAPVVECLRVVMGMWKLNLSLLFCWINCESFCAASLIGGELSISSSSSTLSNPLWKQVQKALGVDSDEGNLNRLEGFTEAVWNVVRNDHKSALDGRLRLYQDQLQPGQKCDAPFPGLPMALPFHGTNNLEWVNELQRHWSTIRDELVDFLGANCGE